MSNKVGFLKSASERFAISLRSSQYLKQPKYEDKLLQAGPEFKHTWAQMAHMHDLRLWTITYAPAKRNNIRRLQEIHLLNNEMWYGVSQALWRRILFISVFFIFVTRIKRDRFMKKYNNDSHDAHWRDTTAHM